MPYRPARRRLVNRRLRAQQAEQGMSRTAAQRQARNERLQSGSGNRFSGGPTRHPPGIRNPMPAVPNVPRAPSAPSVPNGTPAGNSPFLDSTYFANSAQNQFDAQNRLSDIRQQDSYNQTDAFTAKARLDQSEPFAEQGIKENAVRTGLIGSTRTNTQVGVQQRSYLQQRGDIDLKAARTHAANQAAMQAILAGLPIQQAAEMAAAADRQTVRDQAAADAGALTQNPQSAQPTQPAKPGQGSRPTPSKGGGGQQQRATRARQQAQRQFRRERQQVRSNSNGPHRPRHRRSR